MYKICILQLRAFRRLSFAGFIQLRQICTWLVNRKWFEKVVLMFNAINILTMVAMQTTSITPNGAERFFLEMANDVFAVLFVMEVVVRMVAANMFDGRSAYFTAGWYIMDGSLATVTIFGLLMRSITESTLGVFVFFKVFRLIRYLRAQRLFSLFRFPSSVAEIVLFFIYVILIGTLIFLGTIFYFYLIEGGIKNAVKSIGFRNCNEVLKILWDFIFADAILTRLLSYLHNETERVLIQDGNNDENGNERESESENEEENLLTDENHNAAEIDVGLMDVFIHCAMGVALALIAATISHYNSNITIV